MATAIAIFSNVEIKQTTADLGRPVPSQLDWLSIQVSVQAVNGTGATPTPQVQFRVQWSFDNVTWSDSNPRDIIGSTDRTASVIQRFQVKATYWRLVAEVTGSGSTFTCTANALI